MNRAETLDAAKQAVTQVASANHEKSEEVLCIISDLWSAYTGHTIPPADVAAMMILLNVAQVRDRPRHAGSWVDAAGYAACGSELATHATVPLSSGMGDIGVQMADAAMREWKSANNILMACPINAYGIDPESLRAGKPMTKSAILAAGSAPTIADPLKAQDIPTHIYGIKAAMREGQSVKIEWDEADTGFEFAPETSGVHVNSKGLRKAAKKLRKALARMPGK